MTVSPEHGKRYNTRCGQVKGPISPYFGGWICENSATKWRSDGRHFGSMDSPLDLMSEYIEPTAEPAWIKWNSSECPIKSDKTVIAVMYKSGEGMHQNTREGWRWNWVNGGKGGDIIAYRIIEDHEPKMTREHITAQIEALQKQLDELPVVVRWWWNGRFTANCRSETDTHYFDIETINGVPHIHGVAMKECGK